MSLPNYSFDLHKEARDLVCNKLGIKKNILLEQANKNSLTDFRKFLLGHIRDAMPSDYGSSHITAMAYLEKIEDYYCYYYSFTKSKHFCSKTVPTEFLSKQLSKDVLNFENEIIIDFEHRGFKYCLDFYCTDKQIAIKGKPVVYTCAVYTPRTEKLVFVTCSWLYKIHFSEDGKILGIEIPDNKKELHKLLNTHPIEFTMPVLNKVVTETFPAVSNINLKNFGLVDRNYVVGLINYVIDCYNHRKVLNRSNCKVGKHYKEHEVHTSTGEGMSYIALTQYVKNYEPRAKSVYKGGHHQSPIEHERRGHFRRTKKHTGDYDLVNGEFVRVKEGTGEFCIVKPSHVNGRTGVAVYTTR